jgi:hypothetical protein
MAHSAEAFPDFEEEPLNPDVAAHLGRIAHVYEQDGEEIEMQSPGNFPMILHAYMLNRFGKEGRWIYVKNYQEILREHKIGRFITEALDSVYEKERKSVIDPALQSQMLPPDFETQITHAIVIEELKPYLPKEIDPSNLYEL